MRFCTAMHLPPGSIGERKCEATVSGHQRGVARSDLRQPLTTVATRLEFFFPLQVRLFSIIKYESVIHEFDPYFNYRCAGACSARLLKATRHLPAESAARAP